MKNSAKNLLEFSIVLGISTLVITYLVSTTSGRVAPFIPIISEMPFSEPEESIFATGLGISLFATLLIIQVIYRKFEPLAKNLGENYVKANSGNNYLFACYSFFIWSCLHFKRWQTRKNRYLL